MITARDIPMGFGDMDTSLYLLFHAIREQSTVALSGESADELFGGYLQFFDEEARNADVFPWLARFTRHFDDDADVLRPELTAALNLPSFLRDSYAEAVSGVTRLSGESECEYRMRKICHLHLTRFVRLLLDRKDRASMAVGLEVRVPFCDHRLVEYVYNAPWSLKSFDGREKSLLREATADLLPKSVYNRVKSPYPSIQDPRYVIALQEHAKDLLTNRSHPVFELRRPDEGAAGRPQRGPTDHPTIAPQSGTHPGPGALAGPLHPGADALLTAVPVGDGGGGRPPEPCRKAQVGVILMAARCEFTRVGGRWLQPKCVHPITFGVLGAVISDEVMSDHAAHPDEETQS